MGRAVSAIANPIGNITNAVGIKKNSGIGQAAAWGDSMTHPLEGELNRMVNSKPPGSPGVDGNLKSIDQQMKDQADQFRQNIPQTEQMYQNQADQQLKGQLGQNLKSVNTNNAARGLLYGGINQGQRAQQQSQYQTQLGNTRANINANIEGTANQFDQNAINTGLMLQQNQDQIQNQLYQQAMFNMMSQNQVFGGLMSGAGKVGGALAGGA